MDITTRRPAGSPEGPAAAEPAADAADPAALRRRLRRDTAAAHARLDQHFDALLEDEALYRRFIRMNHACHRRIEPLLEAGALLAVFPDWPSWSRLPALEEDMRRMGLAPLVAAPFSLAASDLPAAVGTAYVLEGSRLGAKLLRRRFEEQSAAERWRDASFAYLGAADGDERFKVFMNGISALGFSDGEGEACVLAAGRTFDFFESAARLDAASPGREP